MNYTISPKQVIYNTRTKERLTYFSGRKGEVVFDSVGEFKCYLVLTKLGLPIEVHKFIPFLNWKIDFTVAFVSRSHYALSLLNQLGYTLDKNHNLYIEFKGVIDEKTVNRYKALPELIQNNLVIVTDKPNQITYYCKDSNNIINKKTLSIPNLRGICNGR